MPIIADLHTHLTDHHDIMWNPKIPLIGGADFKGFSWPLTRTVPEAALNRCIRVAEKRKQDTLLGIINFDDTRAQDTLIKLKYEADRRQLEHTSPTSYFLSIQAGMSRISFVSGQEIATDRGHLLTVGAGQNIEYRDLDSVLKQVKNEYGGLILGDHILGPGSISLNRETIERYREFFDAINVWDNNFGRALHDSQSALAQNLGLPVYAASDSHKIRHTFLSATVFQDLDYSKPLESLRQRIMNPNKELVCGSTGIVEKLRHGGGCTLVGISMKSKWPIWVRDH